MGADGLERYYGPAGHPVDEPRADAGSAFHQQIGRERRDDGADRGRGRTVLTFAGDRDRNGLRGLRVAGSRDGSLHWDEVRLKTAVINGKPHVLAFTREITARKHAERRLQEREEHFRKLIERAAANPCDIGAAAVEYLHLLGHVSYAYLWAKMACVAQAGETNTFLDGKIKTAQFYFAHLLPRIEGLTASLTQGGGSLMALADEQF